MKLPLPSITSLEVRRNRPAQLMTAVGQIQPFASVEQRASFSFTSRHLARQLSGRRRADSSSSRREADLKRKHEREAARPVAK
jgi:hypothetical protein